MVPQISALSGSRNNFTFKSSLHQLGHCSTAPAYDDVLGSALDALLQLQFCLIANFLGTSSSDDKELSCYCGILWVFNQMPSLPIRYLKWGRSFSFNFGNLINNSFDSEVM